MSIRIIPKAVQEWVSSPKTAEIVENTIIAVSIETGLKMIGRPTFIMLDKEADSDEKKKFSATKEMLYQGLCLGLYLGVMKHVKHGIYNIVSKGLGKNLDDRIIIDLYNGELKRIEAIGHKMKKAVKDKGLGLFDFKAKKAVKASFKEQIRDIHTKMESNPSFKLPKGAKEFSAIIGSVLMLTIVAPQISHFIIHPLMKVLGFDKHESEKH